MKNSVSNMLTWSNWSNCDHPTDELRFQFDLPSTCSLLAAGQSAPTPKQPVVDLAHFRDVPHDQSVEILVQAMVMLDEYSMSHYLEAWRLLNQEKLLDQFFIERDTDSPVALSSRTFSDGQEWLTLRRGFKIGTDFGALVIVISAACRSDVYEEFKPQLARIVSSMMLVTKPKHQLAESLVLFSRRYPVDFASYLPASWSEQAHSHPEKGQLRVAFTRMYAEVLTGVLSITTGTFEQRTVESCEAVVSGQLKPLIAQGVDSQQLVLQSAGALGRFAKASACADVELPTNDGEKRPCNIEIMFAASPHEWIFVQLIGVTKEESFEGWAINRRAIELFTQHFKSVEPAPEPEPVR